MEILMLPSERSSSDLKVRRLSDIYLLLDLTNYVNVLKYIMQYAHLSFVEDF